MRFAKKPLFRFCKGLKINLCFRGTFESFQRHTTAKTIHDSTEVQENQRFKGNEKGKVKKKLVLRWKKIYFWEKIEKVGNGDGYQRISSLNDCCNKSKYMKIRLTTTIPLKQGLRRCWAHQECLPHFEDHYYSTKTRIKTVLCHKLDCW